MFSFFIMSKILFLLASSNDELGTGLTLTEGCTGLVSGAVAGSESARVWSSHLWMSQSNAVYAPMLKRREFTDTPSNAAKAKDGAGFLGLTSSWHCSPPFASTRFKHPSILSDVLSLFVAFYARNLIYKFLIILL